MNAAEPGKEIKQDKFKIHLLQDESVRYLCQGTENKLILVSVLRGNLHTY